MTPLDKYLAEVRRELSNWTDEKPTNVDRCMDDLLKLLEMVELMHVTLVMLNQVDIAEPYMKNVRDVFDEIQRMAEEK